MSTLTAIQGSNDNKHYWSFLHEGADLISAHHYCSELCQDSGKQLLLEGKAQAEVVMERNYECIPGAVCERCFNDLDTVQRDGIAIAFSIQHAALFDNIPGDAMFGDITGYGAEWRCEITLEDTTGAYDEDIDADDDSSGSGSVIALVFSLRDEETSGVYAELFLENRVGGTEVEDKCSFPITTEAETLQQIINECEEWDVDMAPPSFGLRDFVKSIVSIKDETIENSPIWWPFSKGAL